MPEWNDRHVGEARAREQIEAQDRREEANAGRDTRVWHGTQLPVRYDVSGYTIRSAQECLQTGWHPSRIPGAPRPPRGFWDRQNQHGRAPLCELQWAPGTGEVFAWETHDLHVQEAENYLRRMYPGSFRKHRDNRGRKSRGKDSASPNILALVLETVARRHGMTLDQFCGLAKQKPSAATRDARDWLGLMLAVFDACGFPRRTVTSSTPITAMQFSRLAREQAHRIGQPTPVRDGEASPASALEVAALGA